MIRRQILTGLAASALLAPSLGRVPGMVASARAEQGTVFPDDRILGTAEAPITIIEYSSLTCPHCANLHGSALPRIKETWIAEGKARLVFRHFPLDGLALRAAAVANCVDGERFFAFLDLLFQAQQKWAKSQNPLAAIGQYARLAGLSQERFEACVNDKAEMDRILRRAQDGRQTYDIQSTPTLIVNGRKVEGAQSFEAFDAIFREMAPRS